MLGNTQATVLLSCWIFCRRWFLKVLGRTPNSGCQRKEGYWWKQRTSNRQRRLPFPGLSGLLGLWLFNLGLAFQEACGRQDDMSGTPTCSPVLLFKVLRELTPFAQQTSCRRCRSLSKVKQVTAWLWSTSLHKNTWRSQRHICKRLKLWQPHLHRTLNTWQAIENELNLINLFTT